MILQVKNLKDAAVKILAAVDGSDIMDRVKDTLEIVSVGKTLQLNITNKEYYVRINMPLLEEEPFRALVNAELFLNLVSKLTTDELELKANQTSLVVKANGNYKLPYIYDGNDVMSVPEIKIENPTTTFNISSDILNSIATVNAKEINLSEATKPFQRLYYVDEKGCITFSNGACINAFTLPEKVVLLLNDKIVKLFKLFKSGDVKFTLGFDAYGDTMLTKVKFENGDIEITDITSTTNSLVKSAPANAMRNLLNTQYPYQVTFNKNELKDAISRLLLCNYAVGGDAKNFGFLYFDENGVTITTPDENNKELVKYASGTISEKYSSMMEIKQLKSTLDVCNEDILTFSFGNHKSAVLARGTIYNVFPEASLE